ncbi:adenylate/guanylate cyclase domain-containing protein [Legionella spiritensis]|uniref:adenylate/guanylate cyclase domain-containing protein n=1 Tax=Legionella spiritensis TaxID=452 RepID=UPI000F71E7D8|nr:adenylate/guanylate cyclase domain-containing protein [Legionella spiritensis]VEG92306.1 adenylate cyclase [Legionella spiritensis]
MKNLRHFDEEGRLAAVYELKILDTPRDERYERIVRLATDLFEVPIAFVSIVEKDRQWFKARQGIELENIPRTQSLCNITIQQDHPLIVLDTHLDTRFANNPYVVGAPYMRFYAGVPLATLEGYNVGTLCISDKIPRSFDERKRRILMDLASMTEDQLNLMEVTRLEKKYRLTSDALQKARKSLQLRKDFIQKAFSCYMSDDVVKSLLKSPSQLAVKGDKRKITIVFSDLRNFTGLSETLPPEAVFAALNNLYEHMVNVIEKYGGTIDSFIGDAIMVIFGAPHSTESDALKAVACALDMQLTLKKVNTLNQGQSLPEFDMGIGINTGYAMVGNMGSQKRMQYTAIGSPVNLASRIQDLTIAGQVLISEATFQEVGKPLHIKGHLRVKVKGVSRPITIYDVDGVSGVYSVFLK